jgi:hypothetical protein
MMIPRMIQMGQKHESMWPLTLRLWEVRLRLWAELWNGNHKNRNFLTSRTGTVTC